MKRRDFLKSTLFFAAISTVMGKATGLFTDALAADIFVTPGKLGYKEVSPFAKTGKICGECKYYEAAATGDVGKCTLDAMVKTMKMKKPNAPMVKKGAHCNMFAKKIVKA
jgi:hypothetical protein